MKDSLNPMWQTDTVYRLLVEGVTDYAIYMLDPLGNVANWNAGAQRAKGYRAEEIVGGHFSRFYTDQDRDAALPQRALATARMAGRFEGEGWRVRKDGSQFWAQVVIQPIYEARAEGGGLVGFAKITRDMTERKRQADQLARTRANLDLALGNMSQGLCLFDEHEKLVLQNARFREILGMTDGELPDGASFSDLLWELDPPAEGSMLDRAGVVARQRETHLARVGASRDIVTTEVQRNGRAISLCHRGLPGGGWVTTLDDVTERRQAEDRIFHLAHHDTLTELPNRVTFRERLDDALAARGGDVPCALLYLDLDRFKPVNDTLGHHVGDAVLQVIAGRIQNHLRKHDVVARLGGDEFAILLMDCQGLPDATMLADRLIREISRPMSIKGLQVVVGASVGIACAPLHGRDPEVLLRNADLALYRAKETGRGCSRAYEHGMELVMQERRELERDLRAALAGGEFSLHYQPIVGARRDDIAGFEALLRWHSPTRGQVPPAAFIPFAEEIGLMPELGDWVLRTACREAMAWPGALKVSVNLSPTQFRLPNLAAQVSNALAEIGLAPERLELEITETAMIDDLPSATATLHQLRDLGIQIAMDDFGTGYSSLSFLRTLPFTRIKIDRSFVKDLGNKPEAAAIVRAVTGLCGSLGVAATAEGVETERQMELLRAEGCHEVQGFLISRPRPAGDVNAWITEFHAAHQARQDAAAVVDAAEAI